MRWSLLVVLLLTQAAVQAFCTPCRADQPSPRAALQLEQVLASVEASFPLIRAVELERSIADGEMVAARGGFDLSFKTKGTLKAGYYDSLQVDSVLEQPTGLWGVSAFAGYRLGTGEFPSYDRDLETLEYGEVRGGLNMPLWRNGPIDRRRANLEKAKLGQQIAALSVEEQKLQIVRAATHRYWTWVAWGRRLRIAQDLLKNVEGRSAGLASRVAQGDLAAFEQLDNERAVEQRRAQVALARRGLEQAALELGLYFRDASGRPRLPTMDQLPQGFPSVTRGLQAEGREVERALADRPEPRKIRLQKEQNDVEREFTKNQLAPGIDVQVVGSQDIGPASAERPDLRDPAVQVTLLLDVPLQNRVTRGRAEVIHAAAARLGYQEQFAKEKVAVEVRDARSGILRALERIEAARREVELAAQLERSERIRFEQGDSHLLIVNLREQQTAEAELREVDALLDYFRAEADMIAASGG